MVDFILFLPLDIAELVLPEDKETLLELIEGISVSTLVLEIKTDFLDFTGFCSKIFSIPSSLLEVEGVDSKTEDFEDAIDDLSLSLG